jgi:formylglycine-generating enzyme required for sulfatase activity
MRMTAAALGIGLALGMMAAGTAQADTFGSGLDTFTIDFVDIGNAGNTADGTGYGAVSYNFRIGKYEISQDAIDKATAGGMANVAAGAWSPSRPAADISWFEAAAFANWLNTSTGHQEAYDLTYSSGWSMSVWSSAQAWQTGGENLYRNKDAYYFLPNENEWYKAAFYNSAGSNYYDYATASDTLPTATTGSTDVNEAVYTQAFFTEPSQPAWVTNAGGLSAYETMGQSGNVWEWTESSSNNSNPNANRISRGGGYLTDQTVMLSSGFRSTVEAPGNESSIFGFRVASVAAVPEPSTYAMALAGLACGGYLVRRRRKRA